MLQGTANLEFWETYENSEVISYLVAANDLLKSIEKMSVKQLYWKNNKQIPLKLRLIQSKDQALLDLIEKDSTQAAKAST